MLQFHSNLAGSRMETNKIGTIVYYGKNPEYVTRIVVSIFRGRELITQRTWSGEEHLLDNQEVSKEIGKFLLSHSVERVVLSEEVLPLESE